MKKLLSLLILCLGCFGFLEAQDSIWKPVNTFGPLLGAGPDGSLFAHHGYSGLARSQDEGETWQIVAGYETGFNGYFNQYCFAVSPEGRIFVFNDDQQTVVYSDDAGDTWQQTTSPTPNCAFPTKTGLYAVTNDIFVVWAQEGEIHYTLDGGATWDGSILEIDEETQLSDLIVNAEGDVYVSVWSYSDGDTGIFHSTLSDMENWEIVAGEELNIRDMAFDLEGNVVACGYHIDGSSIGFQHTPGFYLFDGTTLAISDGGIVYRPHFDGNQAVLSYSTDHGEHFTDIGEHVPLVDIAPGGDAYFLIKGHDNHLYFDGGGEYWKCIPDADEIIGDSPTPYHPIVEDGKQWNVLFSYPWNPPEPQHKYTDIYKIEGDTLVDGLSYKVMYTTRNEDLTGWSVCGVIRETEDKQVLYRRDGASYDEILYDFSMEVGDTIIMSGSGFYPDWMFVVETNEILIGGEPRKQIVLEYPWGDREVWIEGIGSLYGIIDSGALFLMGGSTNLLCHYEHGDLIWQNTTPGYDECYMVYPTPPSPPQNFVEGWLEIPTGVTENLYGVACLNGLEVVACGENGKILKTTNGGDSWTVKFEKEGYDMIHVAFADEQVGYACGDSCYWDVYHHKGIIVKTTDGGETWQELPNTNFVYLEHPDFQRTNDLFVVDAETFYLLTAENLLWKTTDGGQSFFCSASFEPLGRIVHCELFFKDEIGYLIAINSDCVTPGIHIYKTTDSGQNWDEVYFNEYMYFTVATHFFDENHVELFGNFNVYQYNLMVTEDGFETVSYLNVATPIMTEYGFGNVSHSKFTSDTYGCVLMGATLDKGSNQTSPFIMKDGWEHCEYVHAGIPDCYNNGMVHCRDLYDIDGIDTTFFIAAENGYIYKTAMIPLGGSNFLMGSEWYYEIENENGSITYQYMYQAGDTIVQDEPTHILVRINTLYDKGLRDEVTHEYVYKRDNKVYWWNKTLEEFTVLYDFGAQEGDEWEIKVGTERLIMHVDAVETIEYEGSFYRMLRVSDAGNIFSGDIVCGIGHLTSFFPERLMNNGDGLRVEGLRCYWIGDELVFKPGDEDCDAVYSEVHGVEEDGPSTGSGTLVVYPNPTDGVLNVSVRLPQCDSSTDQTYRITNLMGQTVLSGSITAETQQINVSNLPKGMYFITFAGETRKFVVR